MVKLSKTREFLITEFLNSLKEDKIPWTAGWIKYHQMNALSNHYYQGVNRMILDYVASLEGYSDPRWMTFKQIKDKGWHLNNAKGKGVPIEFWSAYDTVEKKTISSQEAKEILAEEDIDVDRIKFICKTYFVFNASLVEGIPKFQDEYRNEPIEVITEFFDNYLLSQNIELKHGGNEAFYTPQNDSITMPNINSFNDIYYYYDTLAHEISHSTGAVNRLNRDLKGSFGSINYAKEELRAEIGSSFIISELGLSMSEKSVTRHKAYIQSWIKILNNDPNELFRAITDAEKIEKYILEKGDIEFVRSSYIKKENELFNEIYDNLTESQIKGVIDKINAKENVMLTIDNPLLKEQIHSYITASELQILDNTESELNII